ncbi:beta-ketoacyl-ACP synthase II [Candidatus Viridilinea mediisalina]|uniref:Beta-ketoacyl-ACP synthase II n=1 Tax=Candidatus Viridilinea mediisalina TaxID=2024553 RepID=A0A2A6RIU0_9CHLR|nr:beta-ketoacyl-ACP synthase II [Candidatus Viridilinea mediisalina]PDW02863.1 beta-ketoacyl-[acyl-carrier-protein] synthase II [Candidatus Viridilinea mediisalina]
MAQMPAKRRAALRAELLALLHATEAEDIDARIDELLAEVLEDAPIVAPLGMGLDDEDEDRRIVVTGMGVVSPFGIGVAPFWAGLSQGRSAIERISHFDPSGYPCQIAGQVPGFVAKEFMDGKEARRMSRSSQFAVAAAQMAVTDADLRISGNSEEIGVLIGCGTSAMPDIEQAAMTLLQRGGMKISPFFIPAALPHMPASQVAIQLGLHGYLSAISTACSAGAQAIGEAAEVIRRGEAEIMLAGGAEAPITAFSLGAFCVMRALSSHANHEPSKGSRPFDARRDGFVPGEGAAVLVLERLSNARRRGASILAEVAGYAATADAYHITAPEPDGYGAARAMRRALQNARCDPQQIDYINAHATSTPAGDLAETRAIKHVFGEYAYSVPVSSNKSMIGHLTGAAGAIEAAATILALRHSLIPPTINQEEADPACDLDYVPNQARHARLQLAISNSFAFGGVNAVLVFRRL